MALHMNPGLRKLQLQIEDRIHARRIEWYRTQEMMFDHLRKELLGIVNDIMVDEWHMMIEQQQPAPVSFSALGGCCNAAVDEMPMRLVPPMISTVPAITGPTNGRKPPPHLADDPAQSPRPNESPRGVKGQQGHGKPLESPAAQAAGNRASPRSSMSAHLSYKTSAFESQPNMLAFLEAKNWDSEAAEHPEIIIASAGKETDEDRHPLIKKVEKIVKSTTFDLFIGVMIVVNSIVMGLRLEYEGIVIAGAIDIPRDDHEGNWPSAEKAFGFLEHFFAILFLIELILRMSIFGCSYFHSAMNWMDVLIVFISVLELYIFPMMGASFPNVSFIRVIRIFKMVRVLRIVRVLKFFEKLRVLVAAVGHSMGSLAWSVMLLGIVQLICSIFITQALQDYLQDDKNDLQTRETVYMYYGTFSRSCITMFENCIAPGTWAKGGRTVIFQVSRYYAIFFLGYLAFVSFSMVRVITAIFLKDVLSLAAKDGETVMANMNRDPHYVKKIHQVFERIDLDSSGTLCMEELVTMLNDDQTKGWLRTLGIVPHEVKGLFTLMDDGDDEISFAEFLTGVMRLKDGKVDLATILYENKKLLARLLAVGSKVDKLAGRMGLN